MMKKILAVIALMVSHMAYGQTITDVDAFQAGKDIVIEYTIEAPYGTSQSARFSVVPSVSTDGGRNFTPISRVSGDLENLASGKGKRIVWRVLEEHDQFVHSNVVFKVDIAQVTQVEPLIHENPATQVVNSSQPQSGEDYYRKGQECEKAKKYAEAIKYYRIASQKGYKQADARIQQLQLNFW